MIRMTSLVFSHAVDIGDDAVALWFRPQRPVGFRAGQHGLWAVPHGGLAPFTVASAPEEDLVALGTRLGSQSRMKRALAALTPGAGVRMAGPLSSFTLDPRWRRTVMLAQGIGVTPFRSMLTSAAFTATGGRTTLVHVAVDHSFRADTERTATESRYPTSSADYAEQVRVVALEQPDAVFMLSGTPRRCAARLRSPFGPRRQPLRPVAWWADQKRATWKQCDSPPTAARTCRSPSTRGWPSPRPDSGDDRRRWRRRISRCSDRAGLRGHGDRHGEPRQPLVPA